MSSNVIWLITFGLLILIGDKRAYAIDNEWPFPKTGMSPLYSGANLFYKQLKGEPIPKSFQRHRCRWIY